MADSLGKKRLTLNLSLFANLSDSKESAKSPRNFERGVVGLGIVAAMNDQKHTNDAIISAKSSRAAILAVSPRSQPIPIIPNSSAKPSAKFSDDEEHLLEEKGEMELSESYTCVISHIGNNLIKKREYFDDKVHGSYVVSSRVYSASPSNHGGAENLAAVPFQNADFLSSCHLCQKKLHGLDIFMYRGEKAFCSTECRYKQIASDEHKEKCASGARKPLDSSASPCSGPMLFFAGVAAA